VLAQSNEKNANEQTHWLC